MGKVVIVVSAEDYDSLPALKRAILEGKAHLVAETHDGVHYQVRKDDRGGTGMSDAEGVVNKVRSNLC